MEKKTMMKCDFRPAVGGDLNYITETWLQGEKSFVPYEHQGHYFEPKKWVVSVLLERSTVTIACDPEDQNRILGYSVVEPDKRWAHYFYVRKEARGRGVGLQLYAKAFGPEGAVLMTHKPKNRYIEAVRYCPDLAYLLSIEELSKKI